MIKEAYDPSTGHPVYSPGSGKPAMDCACAYCPDGTPNTLQIVFADVVNCPCTGPDGNNTYWQITAGDLNGTYNLIRGAEGLPCTWSVPVTMTLSASANDDCQSSPGHPNSTYTNAIIEVSRTATTWEISVAFAVSNIFIQVFRATVAATNCLDSLPSGVSNNYTTCGAGINVAYDGTASLSIP